jgi:predicted proteasome-type protease
VITKLGKIKKGLTFLRVYNLSKDNISPEQEFDLTEKNSNNFVVSFSFGRNTKWERFTIFYVNSEGNFYSICPVVPLNS